MEIKDRTLRTAVLVLVLVAIACVVDARKALADPADNAPPLAGELDPGNPSDAQRLLDYLRAATRKACASAELERAQYRLECLQLTYANAVATFNSSEGIDLEAIAANARQRTVASE